jgi:VWFA-related protein
MRLRGAAILLAMAVVAASTPASVRGQAQNQQPVFRAGVELLTVDVTVVDRDGRQVTDLRPEEFAVEVDGRSRAVISAEYVKLVDDTPLPVGAARPPARSPSPDEAFFSTNARTLTPGRLIVLLVDQGNIRTGQGRLMMRSAARFVDSLSPADRVALVAIPRGALVDFTTEHERVREALLATAGQAQPFKGRYHISLSEAFATYEHSDAILRQQLILRECGAYLQSPVEAARCEIEVEQEAGEIVNNQRQQTQQSLRGMREVLRSLAVLDGPKSVILISEGLVLDGLSSDVDEVAAIAADVRASLDVMLLDVPSVDVTESQRPTTPREDRDRQVEGLESLAGLARGALHRVISSGDTAFVRVMRSMAGHYLLGVASLPADSDGRRHRIQVKSTRRGLSVYSRRGFLAPTSPAASSPAEAVTRALRAPLTLNDVPMRMATWTYKEPGGSRGRLLLAAEIRRDTNQPLEYTAGLAVIDRNNRVVANSVDARALRASDADPSWAVYAGTLVLDPGTYLVRFAVADAEGRIGSVERKVDVWQMNATGLTVGDLLVAQSPSDPDTPVVASVEPHIANGRLAALMEIYAPDLVSVQNLEASLAVLVSEDAPPLTTAPMHIIAGASPEVGAIQATISTAALPPGRYLARAVVTEDGRPRGHLVRPFRVVAAPPPAGDETALAMPSVLPAELLSAMLTNLPAVDHTALLQPAVIATVLPAPAPPRPQAKSAWASARDGKLGPAALEALEAGDQPVAAFLRGVDFFTQGQHERAMQQLQVAMQQAPAFAPARLYLGAALTQASRHREGASLLQSVPAEIAGAAPVARMTGLSWLHAGDASLAIAALETAIAERTGDLAATRALALAYIVGNRPGDAAPLLARYLDEQPDDQEALLAGIYAVYARHTPSRRADSIAADRARAETWATAYAARKGAHRALVTAWLDYLQGTP